jgi:hypothetical protein
LRQAKPYAFACIKEHSAQKPYVAISHVWAHGLGNPRENALPTCQLLALNTKLSRLGSNPYQLFWMDTLCIPVTPANLRKQIIDSMASIYAMADCVLVLGACLMSLSGTDLIDNSISYILCCVWMRRSWTLQERLLSRRCIFQFRDEALEVAQRRDSTSNDMMSFVVDKTIWKSEIREVS